MERLEDRTLLSLDTTNLQSALLVPGNSWTYTVTTPDSQIGTITNTVVGPAVFSGNSATEVDSVVTFNGKSTPGKSYYGTNDTGDFVQFGGVNQGSFQIDTTTNHPYVQSFPNLMDAGVPYTFTSTFTIVSETVATGAIDTTNYSESVQYTLLSETPTSITVPAGTFSAYKIQTITTDTQEGVTDPQISTDTVFYAPGIGSIKKLPSDSDGNLYELSAFNAGRDHLEFSQQPTDSGINKKIVPPVVVSVLDTLGEVDTSKTGSVTLSLNSFTNSGKGKLGGTLVAPLVGGIATFSNLSISAKGVYQLKATDTDGDNIGISTKFSVGLKALKVDINSRPRGIPKGVATGDPVLYSIYVNKNVIPSAKPIESETLVDTLPPGFVPRNISANGTFSGNQITWNLTTVPVVNYDFIVPDAETLNGLTSIPTTAVFTRKYTDGTSDTATATHNLKLAITYEVKGNINDAQFQFPAKNIVTTKTGLAGAVVNLIDSTGAVVATGKTKAGGAFKIEAPKQGTYTFEVDALVDSYSTASNSVAKTHIYAGKSVTFLKSNTKPRDLGTLVISKTLFDTAAKILNKLNNYTTSKFQYLETFKEPLFRFNTTSAEGALTALAGTVTSPSVFMDPAALGPGTTIDPWVGAMRMMAGLASLDKRFVDTFKITDQAGKAFSVLLSVQISIGVGKGAFNLNKKFAAAIKGTSLESKIPKWLITSGSKSPNELLRNAVRVAGMTTLGAVLPPLLDLAGVSPTTKNYILGTTFNALRFLTDFVITGKFLDDLVFEAFFNMIRVSFDAAILTGLTGVLIHPELNFAGLDKVLPLLNSANGFVPDFLRMQDLVVLTANQRSLYDPGVPMTQVLNALDKADDEAHLKAVKRLAISSTVNSLGGLLRGGAGVLELQDSAAKKFKAINEVPLVLDKYQGTMQTYLTAIKTRGVAAFGAAAGRLQLLSVIEFFAQSLIGVTQQVVSAVFIPVIVKTGSSSLPLASSSVSNSQVVATAMSNRAALHAVQTAAVTGTSLSKALTYTAGLTQLAKLVKAKDLDGITALYPQVAIDENAVYSGDLVLLYDQSNSALSQLSVANRKVVDKFNAAVNTAVESSFLARMQIDTWGYDPATGNASSVIAQINTAKTAVLNAAKQADKVRAIIASLTAPVALVIDASGVPTDFSSGTTQTFTFTVTNIGSAASQAGTIKFLNDSGELVVQGNSELDLPALNAGASTTVSWQIQLTPISGSAHESAVYQVIASAGDLQAATTDEIGIG